MKLEIVLNMDNAAFEQDPIYVAAKIIRDQLTNLDERASVSSTPLRDINGNTVGRATLTND